MSYVIAVSGGVDSVVLLDIFARASKGKTSAEQLLVAHVDHGIREESAQDRQFVQALAKQYQLPYASTELKLGPAASEELARDARYEYLFDLARQYKAQVVTAHHQDDVIGSVAINLERGTGWRGLAVMSRAGISRPLIGWTKQTIYDYATKHRLEWVEDATNQSDKYLRNRLRKGVVQLPSDARSELVSLRAGQLQLRHDIDQEIEKLLLKFGDSRYHYGAVESQVAVELLKKRFAITGPQAELTLLAIKTSRSSATHVVNKGLRLRFTKTDFIVDSHL